LKISTHKSTNGKTARKPVSVLFSILYHFRFCSTISFEKIKSFLRENFEKTCFLQQFTHARLVNLPSWRVFCGKGNHRFFHAEKCADENQHFFTKKIVQI